MITKVSNLGEMHPLDLRKFFTKLNYNNWKFRISLKYRCCIKTLTISCLYKLPYKVNDKKLLK